MDISACNKRNPLIYHRYSAIFSFCLILLALYGCASTPEPPSSDKRTQLGRIGVIALSSTPRVDFQTFAKGWAAGAAKGGAHGFMDGLMNSLYGLSSNPPHDPYAAMGLLIGAIVLTTVETVVGVVAGGLESVQGKTAKQIENQLNASIGGINLANDLAEQIYKVSGSRPDIYQHTIKHLGPSAQGTTPRPAYPDVSKQGFDTLVEILIKEAGFRGGSGANPIVYFYLNVHIRLVATADETELYTRDFQFLSREHQFEDWFSDGCKELISVFKYSVMSLAERIVDELFLVTNFPFDSGLWAFPGQPEFGACWFRPIYPELKYSSFWYSISHNAPGIHVLFTEVDSVQPLLKWETFPRPRDRKKGNESLLNKISDVSYDLKIWETINDYPERLVYDRAGLQDSQHRLSVSLKPGSKYFWAFRARYKLEGQSQVTRWAFSSIPANATSDYPVRRLGGNCDLDAIPGTNYFRFITPDN